MENVPHGKFTYRGWSVSLSERVRPNTDAFIKAGYPDVITTRYWNSMRDGIEYARCMDNNFYDRYGKWVPPAWELIRNDAKLHINKAMP